MVKELISCRLCRGQTLEKLLSLGDQAFTGVFPKSADEKIPSGPLELVKCGACHLIQLGHSFSPDELYGQNYGYRSGLNQSMVSHLAELVSTTCGFSPLKSGDIVLDIGSNDSTLLRSYPPNLNLRKIGVDPSGRKFIEYYPEDVTLIPDFFSKSSVSRVIGTEKARVITSIAMFYDLEEPLKFVGEVASCLAEDGLWVFEQSYLPSMLSTLSYDTICHEHLEYYGLRQIKWMLDEHHLKMVDVRLNSVNGGSFRVTAAHLSNPLPEATETVNRLLQQEVGLGLATSVPYDHFARMTEAHRTDLLVTLNELKQKGKKVFGYGASTKGNVLLQYCGLSVKQLPFIAEVNEDKFGRVTPGTHIPIISEAEAKAMKPDVFLVLPWHFRSGILLRERAFLEQGGQFLFPLPKIEMVNWAALRSLTATHHQSPAANL